MRRDEWFDGFGASMVVVDHLLFGSLVIDAATGRVVAGNPRAAELLGGALPERIQDLVEAGVLARPSFDGLAALAGEHPSSWRVEVTLHQPGGRVELTLFGGSVEHPGIDARAVVVMVCERGRERIFIDVPPADGPRALEFAYDRQLRVRGVDPRLEPIWADPGLGVGAFVWLGVHPADLHLVVPWLTRLVTGQLDRVEYTVRVVTQVGNWIPAHVEVRRLLGDAETPFLATFTFVDGFRETIPEGQLTRREQAVVAALFDGHRIPQIAARDGVSVKTLRNQLTGVYRKLGVADQVELLSTFHRPVEAPPRPRSFSAWDIPDNRLG